MTEPTRKPFPHPDQFTGRDLPLTPHRAAQHRLADAMRRAIQKVIDENAGEEDLLAAAEALERFITAPTVAPPETHTPAEASLAPAGDSLADLWHTSSRSDFFDYSPLIGLANPVAPPLRLWAEDGIVHGTATFGTAYEGPPGHVHGGFIAAAFDEVLGMAQSMTGNPGMTGTLTVRYRSPTPLHRELQFRGRADRVEGRKIFTSGTLHVGDVLCAEAEAVFISVDFERIRRIAGERRGRGS